MSFYGCPSSNDGVFALQVIGTGFFLAQKRNLLRPKLELEKLGSFRYLE